jgi:ABC-type sugar transport system permease subunit
MTSATPSNVPVEPAASAVIASPTSSARRRRRMAGLTHYLYLLPMLVLVGAFLLYPAADTLWISFTNWNGLNDAAFIGLQNYIQLFSDAAFSTSFFNTLIWVGGVLVLQVGLGLLVAVILNGIWGETLFKTIFYLPATISGAATGVVWYFMFDPTEGVFNTFLRAVHLGGVAQDWLANPPINTYAMIVAATWQGLGPTMMLFLVGLQNIPKDPIEAALIDGAGGASLFRYITLPLLRPMATIVVGIALINSFKVFDLIWVMTQGGPYRSSETLAVTMYREAFVSFQLAYGASVAVVLSLIVLVVSIFYLRAMFRRDAGVY